jgi:hypothetical protein
MLLVTWISFKRMLVLIKNLDTSEKLIEYALNLARDLHISVQLHYVENPSQYPLGVTDLTGAAVTQLQKSLKDRVATARTQFTDQVNTEGWVSFYSIYWYYFRSLLSGQGSCSRSASRPGNDGTMIKVLLPMVSNSNRFRIEKNQAIVRNLSLE